MGMSPCLVRPSARAQRPLRARSGVDPTLASPIDARASELLPIAGPAAARGASGAPARGRCQALDRAAHRPERRREAEASRVR